MTLSNIFFRGILFVRGAHSPSHCWTKKVPFSLIDSKYWIIFLIASRSAWSSSRCLIIRIHSCKSDFISTYFHSFIYGFFFLWGKTHSLLSSVIIQNYYMFTIFLEYSQAHSLDWSGYYFIIMLRSEWVFFRLSLVLNGAHGVELDIHLP